MITVRDLQINQISASNNPLGVDMLFKKYYLVLCCIEMKS